MDKNVEFCSNIAPSVLEMQKLCSEMSEEEFMGYREDVLKEVAVEECDIIGKFAAYILDMIHHNLYSVVISQEKVGK